MKSVPLSTIKKTNIPRVTRLINDMVKAPNVRLIDEHGEQRGIVKTSDALAEAHEKELDLVVVAEKADPPVCKLVNYGKYKYRQNRQIQKQKAGQRKLTQKGIRLSMNMGPHDIDTRKKQAEKFLEQGHRVKVEMLLRGRERAHARRAEESIRTFTKSFSFETIIEQELKRQQNAINLIIRKK